MIYFLGYNFNRTFTGVERAQLNRFKLFKKYGVDVKLVYLCFNPSMNYYAEQYGIDQDYISMFDVLQEIDIYPYTIQPHWIKQWENQGYRIEQVGTTQDVRLYDGEQFVMYAHFFDEEMTQLCYINYFDSERRKIKRELYDRRGFLSCTCLLNDRNITSEIYYSPRREKRLEIFYKYHNQTKYVSNILLYARQQVFQFHSYETLYQYFLEKLYQSGDQIIIDRPLEGVIPVATASKSMTAHVFMHSNHILPEQLEKKGIVPVIKSTFQYSRHFDNIIVSTEQQKEDLEVMITDSEVRAIPVGYVDNETITKLQQKITLLEGMKKIKIVSFGRYSIDKQLHHQIHVVHKLIEDFPDLEFQMFGYGGQRVALEKLVKELGLENNVFINPFTQNVEQEYEDALLSLSTSYSEGFSLAIMESLSNGVPVFAYDVKYGPSALIHDKENGELVPVDDQEALYLAVKAYLNDDERQLLYKRNCLKYIQEFSELNNIKRWKEILKIK